MPQFGPVLAILASTLLGGCVVSFDGYELGASADASSGGGGGGNGGSAGVGSGGAGGSGGSGATGATGASGGVVGGGGVAGSGGGGGSTGGSGGLAGGGGAGGSLPTCSSQGGPMVLVPKTTGGGFYCVDATEVTQSAYQAFLITGPDALTQIAGCTGQTFTPAGTCNGWSPTQFGSRPAVCVDWCDAYGFCNFAGKHLCGKIDGGAVDPATSGPNDETQDEWYNACSAGGTQLFPYGNFYDGGFCNGLNAGTISPSSVLQFAQCVGGYPGLNGMSGNVREWTNACTGSNCMQRGGSWVDGATGEPNLTCESNALQPRMQVNDKIGFRCCADAN